MADQLPGDIHLNLNVQGLSKSATLEINEKSAGLQAAGKKVYRLGLGQSPFPVPDNVVDSLKEHAGEKDYLAVKGLPELRKAVSDFHNRTQQMNSTQDDVVIAPGSKELMFILQLVYNADILIPTPSWVSYAPQGRIIGRQVRWVATSYEDKWKLSPETLDKVCSEDPGRPRLLILNYPSNPTGRTFSAAELQEIAAVSRKYGIVVLSDEIYGEVEFSGEHLSIARYYPEGTIVSSGLSKWCGAGGWRLGTFVFPEKLRWISDAMAVVASETYTSTSAPIQYASITAFEGGAEIDSYLADSRKILKALADRVVEDLRDFKVHVHDAEGGFYVLPDFSEYADKLLARGISNSSEMCSALLTETGVAFLPGVVFGRPDIELTGRLAFVDFDGAEALKAAANLDSLGDDFVEKYCPNVVNAILAMKNWFTSL